MPKHIVHAGLHKTGSSAVQLALKKAGTSRGHTCFLPIEGIGQSDQEWRRRFDALASTSCGILSDENLLGSPFDCYSLADRRIKALREAMGGRSVLIVVYIRPQPQWLQSLYLQGIQEGRYESPDEFMEQMSGRPNLRWANLADVVAKNFKTADLDIRAYNSRDAVSDFFSSQALALPSHITHSGPRINQSVAPIQGTILRELIGDPDLDAAEKIRIRRVFQGILASGAIAGFSSFKKPHQEAMRDLLVEDFTNLETSGLMSTRMLEIYGQMVKTSVAEPLLPQAEGYEATQALTAETIRSLRILAKRREPQDSSLFRLIRKIASNARGLSNT